MPAVLVILALTSSWVSGKSVLIMRVNYEDRLEEVVTVAAVKQAMDDWVLPFYDSCSYGQDQVSYAVTDEIYTVGAAVKYNWPGGYAEIMGDVLPLVRESYNVSEYDIRMVVFPRLSAIPNSGLGNIGVVFMNGVFSPQIVAHELGHGYGLNFHANAWVSTDGEVFGEGSVVEYNDPYDLMGSGVSISQEFGPEIRRRLGWLPESAIDTVTESGIYRVFRFDHVDADLTKTMVLRLKNRGNEILEVSYRQSGEVTSGGLDGAMIYWKRGDKGTVLLDAQTPGVNPYDSVLPVGSMVTDERSGIGIRAISRGGSGAGQWLEVEIVMRPLPKVRVWGGGIGEHVLVPWALSKTGGLAAGDRHNLHLGFDGVVSSWGEESLLGDDPLRVPPGLGDVVKISTGAHFSMALTADGTITSWGYSGEQIQESFAALEGVIQIEAGNLHGLALLEDGTVRGFGSNESGQSTVPPGLDRVVAIAAGGTHNLALRGDGLVIGWGSNSFGKAEAPLDLEGVVAIAAGENHSAALLDSGEVVEWGFLSTEVSKPEGLNNVIGIEAGDDYTLALRRDGTVVVWGSNNSGQCEVPENLPPVQSIHGGLGYVMVLLGDLEAEEFSEWRIRHRLSIVDARIADPDGDGFSNLMEYALGLNPRLDDAVSRPWLEARGEQLIFGFSRPESVRGIRYMAQYSTDMENWQGRMTSKSEETGWVKEEVAISQGEGGGYFRLLIEEE